MKAIALITGGSRGIGKACAELFEENGIEVLAPTRKEMNLTDPESIRQYVGTLNKSVSILVNNAGINPISQLSDINFRDANEAMQTNFWAPTLLIHLLGPKMQEMRYGRIVNISSIWGTVTKEGRGIYAASKAGLEALTRTAAVELAPSNILVNAVAPGYVMTELTKQNNTQDQIEQIKKNLPIRRLAETREIAELVYFLCSTKNTFVTGQTILADGGYSII